MWGGLVLSCSVSRLSARVIFGVVGGSSATLIASGV